MIHRTEPYTIIAEQRSLIEDLAKSNQGYISKFERLKLSCEEAPIDLQSVPGDTSSSMPSPKTLPAHGLPSALDVDAPSQRESSADAKGLDRDPYKGFDIPNFPSSDRLGWLLQQYSNLMRTLLKEVSAPTYEIAEESRSRIRADIVLTQNREMNTLNQAYRPGLPSLTNSSNVQVQHPVTTGSGLSECSARNVDMDPISAPVQNVSTREFEQLCTSQSTADLFDSTARRSSPALPAAEEDDEGGRLARKYQNKLIMPRRTEKRRSESANLHPENPLGRPVPQWENNSANPRSSKRSRVLEVKDYAVLATVNEDPPAPQSGAIDVRDLASDCQGTSTNSATRNPNGFSMARDSQTLRQKQSDDRILKEDGIEDCTEHIVDELLATWTTLPLHAS